jgi:hypothetical protein
MSNSARFQAAVSTIRPRGARVIETYSPKLGRRLQCFGEEVFRQWICLEADPSVQSFCERPAYLNNGDGERLADFWVRQQNRETLLILGEDTLPTSVMVDDIELPVRTVAPAELAAARTWIDNWTRMLPAIIACRSQISSSVLHSIMKFVSVPMPLSCIEQEFATGDPTPVRSAVFSLLHRGQLRAPQLHTEPLSFLTCFQPVEAAA